MIRGYIEQVTQEIVSGWLYSEAFSVRDRRVLAVLDQETLGVGRIEHFRQDLADAGLGDGFLGFHFRVRPLQEEEMPRVAIRLEGGDALLLQRRSRVAAPGGEAGGAAAGPAAAPVVPRRAESSLRWMQARGWLNEFETDFIRLLEGFGVYVHALEETPGTDTAASPEEAAAALFSLFAMSATRTARHAIASVDEMAGVVARAAEAGEAEGRPLPVHALWCSAPGRLGIAEASHLDPAGTTPGAGEALTDYAYGPDRLLFLHQGCRYVPRARSGGSGRLEVFTALLPPEPKRGPVVVSGGRR